MLLSLGCLCRPFSALEVFTQFPTLGIIMTKRSSNSRESSMAGDSSSTANFAINAGSFCNLSSSDKDRHVPNSNMSPEFIMVGSIPILYKNQPIRHSICLQNFSSSPYPQTNGLSQRKRIELGGDSAIGTGVIRKQHFSKFASDLSHEEQSSPLLGGIHYTKRRPRLNLRSGQGTEDASCSWSAKNGSSSHSQFESMTMSEFTKQWDEFALPTQFGNKRKPAHVTKSDLGHSYSTSAGANSNSNCSEDSPKLESFDICLSASQESAVVLNPSLHTRNYKSWKQVVKHEMKEASHKILRPGMVLLKHYITHNEQVEIVRSCQKLGVGPGGFYQPGYKDGSKLRLQMMCLGLSWDPETRKYEDCRSVDGSETPGIPHHFSSIVKRALQGAHALINKEFQVTRVEDKLPSMSPNICIVNFYSATGRLGLHQDRDESRESLRKGLPVVSISVGDSAEFLYGDERDVNKAKKVILESGDVLLFGGKSRHVYHGISSIIPNSAPKELLEEARLRPGRLNLTFREY